MSRDKLLAEWFWTDRWTGSSAFGLPLEARGLYREMLTQAWRRAARLPADHAAVRRLCGVDREEWDRSWPIVAPYWTEIDGCLVNETQLEVYEEASRRSESKARAGKARSATANRVSGRFSAAHDQHTTSTPASTPPAEQPAQPPAEHQPPSPSPSLRITKTNYNPPPPRPDLQGEQNRHTERTGDGGEVEDARRELVDAIQTARNRIPSLAGLSRGEILALPEYHAPTGPVRLSSDNPRLLRATAAKLRGDTTQRKATAPAWDRPDTSEAKLDADASAWIADHWPEDSDPLTREDLRSLLECLTPPPDLAGRIEVQLRFTRYPQLWPLRESDQKHDPATLAPARDPEAA